MERPIRCGRPARLPVPGARGFTLLELMMAVTVLGVLAALAVVSWRNQLERMKVTEAISDLSTMSTGIEQFIVDNTRLPATLAEAGYGDRQDPWGNTYAYLAHDSPASRGAARKDRRLVPINNDYDLYSVGKDGRSVGPLTAPVSQDDIVRAANGAFIGRASDF